MSEQDLRQQAHQIREALERYSREELIHILTHVYRQYVVEGSLGTALPPPTALQADELTGLSFAQVIERLQLRLDLPELQLFDVQGGRVSVRIEGRLTPLDAPTGRPEGPALPGARQPVQFTLRQQPAAAPPPVEAHQGQAAPQAPGVSMQAARPAAPAPVAPPPVAQAPVAAAPGPAPVPAGPVAAGPVAAPSARPAAPASASPGAVTASSARPAAARPAPGQGQGQGQAPTSAPPSAGPPPKDDRQDGGGRFTLLEID
jgi:hypothetical protein